MTLTLTEFLLARIAEDEWAAQRASTEPPGRYPDAYTREHVARWDPVRALAECAAKRLILEMHQMRPMQGGCPHCGLVHTVHGTTFDPAEMLSCDFCPMTNGECDTACLLALPYADHPDYDAKWKL